MTHHTVIRALTFSLLCVAATAGQQNSTPVAGSLPLNDLGRGLHAGFEGGLYPRGMNMPPASYRLAGLEQAHKIEPLDAQGQSAREGGRIGLLMLGTANTRLVAENLRQLAASDTERNPAVVPVNGAAGLSIRQMAAGTDRTWAVLPSLLEASGLTAAQVQVLWLDATSELVEQSFPYNAQLLQADLATIVALAQQELPNLRLVLLSSGVYSARHALDSYESAFAVKWLIEEQIEAAAAAASTASADAPSAPWIGWGPYLWADGVHPRSDGLTWNPGDFTGDGQLLSTQGAKRAAGRLLLFLHTEALAQSWFLAHADTTCQQPALVSTFGLGRLDAGAPSIALSVLPTQSSLEPLWIAVSGAPASTSSLFLIAEDPQGEAVPEKGPLLLSPESARAVPVSTDAAGRAWFKLGRVPAAHEKLCGQTLCVQFVSSADGALVASPGLRLQGGH